MKTSDARLMLQLTLGSLLIITAGFAAVAIYAINNDSSGAGPVSSTLDINLEEFSITGDLVAPAGDITLLVHNNGSMDHNLAVRELGLITPNFGSGGTVSLPLGELAPGEYTLFCEIAGHEAAGMVATLTVTANGGSDVVAGGGGGHGHSAGDLTDEEWAAMDEAMMQSMLAFPAETEKHGNPILEPTEVLADGTKVFDLTAEIVDWEVEPGVFVEAWTYNGVVPAPQIKLDQGDHIQVRVLNNLPMGTDIHWHGVHTPNDQDGVAPYTQDFIPGNGGTFTYEFTVDTDAIGMYHAHHHGQMQVVNGMFGAITIGDNPIPYGRTISGVTIPDEEEMVIGVDTPMVLNDAGTIGLTLNGKSFPATQPYVMNQGEWGHITYYNEGLQIHPMHLHQFPQLVYAKDGIPLDEPYWVDTINVAPGERYSVIFRADDPGVWVWHCHILTHVERTDGMFGMVTAFIVNETPGHDSSEFVQPHDWEGRTTSPDGPVPADGAHSHGDGDGSHSHDDEPADQVEGTVEEDEEDVAA
ncbi:MAG: multicopper oxidase domain-containing protein [Actinomycetota bacterium]